MEQSRVRKGHNRPRISNMTNVHVSMDAPSAQRGSRWQYPTSAATRGPFLPSCHTQEEQEFWGFTLDHLGGLNSAISFQTSVVERDLPALTGAHPQAEEDDVDHCSQRGAGALAQSCGTDPDSVHWHCRKALRVWYSQDTPKRGRGARQNDRYPSKKRRIHG